MKMIPFLRSVLVVLIAEHCLCSFIPPDLGGASESSGLSLSDITRRKSGSEYVALGNGRDGKAGSRGYERGDADDRGHRQDSGRYNDQDSNHKGYDVGRQSEGQAQSLNQGKNKFEQHGSGEYKKGFHKSGFKNNYHKDESGNKETFYEDSDDEKGHRGFDNKGGYYGQRSQDAFRDGRHDGAFTGKDRGQQGQYDNGAGFNNRRGYNGAYDDNRYYDDRRNFLQDGAGRAYDRKGNEAYYRREQPYHNHAHYAPAPLVSGPLYSRDYLDAPPRYYEETFVGRPNAYRIGYFPDRRDYHGGELFYPNKAGYGGDYGNGNAYDGAGYGGGYGNGYRKNYQLPVDGHNGYRRPY